MRKTRFSSIYDINITSLVDVTMVLLIIFMLTAPFIQAGIKVKLPRAKSTIIKEREGVIVVIRQDGEVYLNNTKVSRNNLSNEFRKLKVAGEQRVFIRADEKVEYGVVMDVIGKIKEVGIDQVGMITEMQK
jgi:biopolymer transport protein TolR